MNNMLDQFSRTQLLLGKEAIEKLQSSRVAVFGIGGVGGYVCEALIRSGVGAFDLIDDDQVCLTNLNRQIIATRKTIGHSKADVMKERMLEINPDADITVRKCFFLPENADEFPFDEYDYVVDAVDTVSAKLELVMQAQKHNVPIISCMGAGNKLDGSQFRVADIYQTRMCPLAKVMRYELRRRGVKKLKVVYSEEQPKRPIGDMSISFRTQDICPPGEEHECTERRVIPGSVAFVPSVAGLLMAGEVVLDLTRSRSRMMIRDRIRKDGRAERPRQTRAPHIVEMSDIDPESPDRLFHTYSHSRCAEIFHRRLKEVTGIDAIASFVYGNAESVSQIILKIWVKDSPASETLLNNSPYRNYCDSSAPLFRSIINCLLFALSEDNNPAMSVVCALWDKQQACDAGGEKRIFFGIDVFSYLRCYLDELMGRTKADITRAFGERFPDYLDLECCSFSLKAGPTAHDHLYLFLTPDDMDRAMTSGDAEEMRKTAYDIISGYDVFGLLSYGNYVPQIESRRALTSEQLFFIARE